jgi:uncharacterized repeat protein (TIGR04076 family)
MTDRYAVKAKVISQKGNCVYGHRVGDEWVISRTTPAGICMAAFNSFFPDLRTLMFGGVLPWSDDPDAVTVACPDSANPLVFELRRIREE